MRRFASPRLALGLCLGLLLPASLLAQCAFWVPRGDEMAKLLHYQDGRAVVERDGVRETFEGSRYAVGAAFEYADGYVLANPPNVAVYESRKRYDFLFRVLLLPSRDYENAYAVVRLGTPDKGAIYLPQNAPGLKAGQPKSIRFKGSVNLEIDPTQVHVHFFCDGKELYQVPTEMNLKGKSHPPTRARGSREPELLSAASKPVPPERVGEIASEGASFAVTVADSGYGFDIHALDAYSAAMEEVGINLLKASRYAPGSEEGFFQAKQLVVRIDFDEAGRYRFSTLSNDSELSYY